MQHHSRWAILTILAALPIAGAACRPCCLLRTPQPSEAPANEVLQQFPAAGPAQTAWRVRWAQGPGMGLYITGAWFRRKPTEPWIKVLYDARIAELFVPYHSGSPRYYDLTTFNFSLVQATAADAGCCGTLLGTPPVVVKEIRDRGPAWKDDQQVYRGQELVLWSTLDAANYNYIIQYSFRDDGVISFRAGATARNLPGAELEAHMHNVLWRVDMDLDGAGRDGANLVRHVEPSGTPQQAVDLTVPFNGGVEGSAVWNPLEFTMVEVMDNASTNTRGHHISYELMPYRAGSSRHAEAFTSADFWVTRYRATEMTYAQLPSYVADGQPVTDGDLVLWHAAPIHHQPRDEDGEYVGNTWHGVALVMWGGFDLKPRNLFSETPLHP